jgi:hypothetical protein
LEELAEVAEVALTREELAVQHLISLKRQHHEINITEDEMTVKRSKAAIKTSEKTKFISIEDKENLARLKQSTVERYKSQLAFERKWDRKEKQEEVFKTIKASKNLKSVIKVLGIVFAVWCILEWASSVRFDPATKRDIWNGKF